MLLLGRVLAIACSQMATVSILFLSTLPIWLEDFTMIRKISLAVVLMTMAGVASAHDSSNKCFQILWFTFCPSPPSQPTPVKAPEIDPASAMAGLTMLAGGLAVLRGRRKAPPV
jgi:hypothetical protein